MSAEVAGFERDKDGNISFAAANSAANIMYETGVSEGRAWSDGLAGGQYGTQVLLAALRRRNMLKPDVKEEEILQEIEKIENETLPGKRRKGVEE